MWTVYCYQNKLNGKRYIGVTKKTKNSRAGKNGAEYIRKNHFFGQAIQKYGWDNFEYSILALASDEYEGSELEKYYIELFQSFDKNYGYNGNRGGAIPTIKRVIQYSENGDKIKEYDSVKQASNECNIVGSLIIQSCHKSIKLAGGYIWRYKNNENSDLQDINITPFSGERPVAQLNLKGDILGFYNSAKEAEQATGASRSKICMCCKGKRKTAGGYKWEYTKGFGLKDVYSPKPSPVYRIQQYDLDGNFIEEFESQNDAHRKTGFSASMIGECCRGIRESACGYIWKYI